MLQALNNIGTEEWESGVKGQEEVIKYFIGYITAVPDSIFLVHEWQLFNRAHNTSCLVFKFSFTGAQIFQHESKCNVDTDVVEYTQDFDDLEFWAPSDTKSMTAAVVSDDKAAATTSSIKFREMSQHRGENKRRKVSTIGQYVNSSKVNKEHLPVMQDLKESIAAEPKHDLYTILSVEKKDIEHDAREILPAAEAVNIRGVMRFSLNQDHQVVKIHCVHIHGLSH
jgi:hypothetical protein